MKTIIYSLRTYDEKTVLDISLTGNIIADTETLRGFKIKLPTGVYDILFENWLNRDRIFDDGKVFFLVCNKKRNTEHVKRVLMEYSLNKLKTRSATIEAMMKRIERELAAA